MELSKKEKAVLQILVGKELNLVKEDSEKLAIVNSPFLGKVALNDSDIEFIKNGQKYLAFLEDLIKKLK